MHLLDGNLIEFHKPFTLGNSIIDKHGIDILHIRQTYQFVDVRIVTDVAFQVGISLAPLLGSHSEHGHIQYIGFLGIDDACLCWGDFFGNQMALDSIRMDAIVDLG